jgi:hypothetical protein
LQIHWVRYGIRKVSRKGGPFERVEIDLVSERLYKFALDSSGNSFGWALGENGLDKA